MITAIYARQSIERQDSASIEAQIEQCINLAGVKGWSTEVYKDVGFSGKNINRPDFERLIDEIESGKINRVISYRLDRISRSISDFANLLTLFEKYNVEYLSATEQFDTSTPMGKAMVYIVMVFAQLERETIQQRIIDNYFYRARQGLFTGGNTPIGYKAVKVLKGGKNISVLEIDEKHSDIVKEIFESYVVKNKSLSSIVRELNSQGKKLTRGTPWDVTKIKRVLRSVPYAAADSYMYEYGVRKGYQIANDPSQFDGEKGLVLYGKNVGKHTPTTADRQIFAVGEHEPLISSEYFLAAQHKLTTNRVPPRSGTGTITWLTGLLKCDVCGYAVTVKTSRWKDKSYITLYCSGFGQRGVCDNNRYLRKAEIEAEIESRLLEKINSFLQNPHEVESDTQISPELNVKRSKLLSDLSAADAEIENLIRQLGNGSVVDKYIQNRITQLDKEKNSLQTELDQIDLDLQGRQSKNLSKQYLVELAHNALDIFNGADTQTKNHIAKSFLKRIYVGHQTIRIEWLV